MLLLFLFLPFSYVSVSLAQQNAGVVDLPETGQIKIRALGDDGDIKAGVGWPSPRFIDLGDGTIRDNLTGLMWLKDAGCLSGISGSTYTTANITINNFNQSPGPFACTDYSANYSDWHLPTITQLLSLANANEDDLASWLVSQSFVNVITTFHWSLTEEAQKTDRAWMMNMDGSTDTFQKTFFGRVLAVRETNESAPARVWQTKSTDTHGVTWPSPRFVENVEQGTVEDRLTGLIWLKEADCLASGINQSQPGVVTWQEALDAVENFNSKISPVLYQNCTAKDITDDDWRLPNRKELLSLIDFSKKSPSLLTGHPFVLSDSQSRFNWLFWSSTDFAPDADADDAWIVDLRTGNISNDNKEDPTNLITVWAVRGGTVPLIEVVDEGDVPVDNLSFETVDLGQISAIKQVTVKNVGYDRFVINNIDLTGAGFQRLSGELTDCNIGIALHANEQCDIRMTFEPASVGESLGTLTVTSDIHVDNTKEVNLSGFGSVELTVNKNDQTDGSGTIRGTAGPDEVILCDSICATATSSFNLPSTVTLVAEADVDSIFTGWSDGSCAGTSPSCQVTMDDHKSVTASFSLKNLSIIAVNLEGGTIEPYGTISVLYGDTNVFLISPNIGFLVSDVTVDGTSVFDQLEDVAGTDNKQLTLNNITANHSIIASFKRKVFTINSTAGLNGSVETGFADLEPDTPGLQVLFGDDPKYIITPDTGFEIEDVLVDSVSVIDQLEPGSQPDQKTYTFLDMDASHSIEAAFSQKTYTVTHSVEGNGTITPPSPIENKEHGSDITLTISPDIGFFVASVRDNGFPVTDQLVDVGNGVKEYTITAFDKDHDILAIILAETPNPIIDSAAVAVETGANGTIFPEGAIEVEIDTDETFDIQWEEGTVLFDVLVDSKSVLDDLVDVDVRHKQYTFKTVEENHTIIALYKKASFNIMARAEDPEGNPNIGGTIVPNGTVNVSKGDNKSFTIIPDTESSFSINDVLVDDVSVLNELEDGDLPGQKKYTFVDIQADHTIVVIFAKTSYTVTHSVSGVGSITPESPVTALLGETVKLTITPNTGNFVASVRDNGKLVTDQLVDLGGGVKEYTIASIGADHAILAIFLPNTTNPIIESTAILAEEGADGTIDPNGAIEVEINGFQTFDVQWELGTNLLDVRVNGNTVLNDLQDAGPRHRQYMFTNVQENQTIVAAYILSTSTVHTIQSIAQDSQGNPDVGGTIASIGDVPVLNGTDETFTIIPDSDNGYFIQDVLADGESVLNSLVDGPNPGQKKYTFKSVQKDHTILAIFAQNTYTVTHDVEGNGTIDPISPIENISHGASVTLTITPDEGNLAASVLDNGIPVSKNDLVDKGQGIREYTIDPVTENHSIFAIFMPIDENPIVGAFTIKVDEQAGGTITPSGDVEVQVDSSQSFDIQWPEDTILSNIYVDDKPMLDSIGIPIDPSPVVNTQCVVSEEIEYITCTFEHVVESHTIIPVFTSTPCFTITPSVQNLNGTPDAGGTIDPSEVVCVNQGESQSFTFTPDSENGYSIFNVQIDGTSVLGDLIDGTEPGQKIYTFDDVQDTHTIDVIFTGGDVFIITSSVEDSNGNPNVGGTIDPLGYVPVYKGNDQSFSITPDTENGYTILDILVDDVSVLNELQDDTYTFIDINADHTINVIFSSCQGHRITAEVEGSGTIEPSGEVCIEDGESITFRMNPAEGYHIDDLTVDGESVGRKLTYSFIQVTEDHTIRAVFEEDSPLSPPPNVYIITAVSGDNGEVFPSGEVPVVEGESQDFVMLPDEMFQVADVQVNGTTVGTVKKYIFASVTQDHTLAATFEPLVEWTITAQFGNNGTIDPEGAVKVKENDNQTFEIKPFDESLFHVDDVKVDGTSIGAAMAYSFIRVMSNHSIEAAFAPGPAALHTLTFVVEGKGEILPNIEGKLRVIDGEDQKLTILPSDGYHIQRIEVNNLALKVTVDENGNAILNEEALGSSDVSDIVSEFTIKQLSADYTIKAVFAEGSTGVSMVPSSHDYGTVGVGNTELQTFVVNNTGSSTFTVSNISITDPDDLENTDLPFAVEQNTCTNFAVSLSGKCQFDVGLTPVKSTSIEVKGQLTVTASSIDVDPVTAQLTGTGIYKGTQGSELLLSLDESTLTPKLFIRFIDPRTQRTRKKKLFVIGVEEDKMRLFVKKKIPAGTNQQIVSKVPGQNAKTWPSLGDYETVIPEITSVVDPVSGEPVPVDTKTGNLTQELKCNKSDIVKLNGKYFGTKKRKVFLTSPLVKQGKPQKLKVVKGTWIMDPKTGESSVEVLLSKKSLIPGKYNLTLDNKIGEDVISEGITIE